MGPSINDVGNFPGFLTHPLPHVDSFLVLSVGNFDQFLPPPPPSPSQLPTLFMDGLYTQLQIALVRWLKSIPLKAIFPIYFQLELKMLCLKIKAK